MKFEPGMREALFDGHALAGIEDETVGDEVFRRRRRSGEQFLLQCPLTGFDPEGRRRFRFGEERRFTGQKSVDDSAEGPEG